MNELGTANRLGFASAGLWLSHPASAAAIRYAWRNLMEVQPVQAVPYVAYEALAAELQARFMLPLHALALRKLRPVSGCAMSVSGQRLA